MKWGELLGSFLEHLEHERAYSKHTIAGYRYDLGQFLIFAQQKNAQDDLSSLSKDWLLSKTGKPSTLKRKAAALRSFLNYVQSRNLIAGVPKLKIPKLAKKLPKVIDVDTINQTLDIEDPSEILLIRDLAMAELLYSSGLRLQELVHLCLAQVNLGTKQIMVVGKGDKLRVVPIGSKALLAIEKWLIVRENFAKEDALFVNNRGRALSARSVQLRLRKLFPELGMHPHLLRHCCASHLLESSGDLREVQEILGHANLSTTEIYTHLNFQHLAKSYDQAHPLSRRKT